MNTRVMISLIFVAITAILCGCGGGGGSNDPSPTTGTVQITVKTPSGLASTATRSVSEIKSVRVTISGSGISSIVKNLTLDPTTRTAVTTIEVSPGERKIVAEALNSAGATIYSGEFTATVNLAKTTYVNITLTPVMGTVNVDITIHTGFPDIVITQANLGTTDNLKGVVTGGLDPVNLAVVVYIKVGGAWWGPKPTWASPLTLIKPDGTWETDITTGGVDTSATEVLAFLVYKTTVPPSVSGGTEPSITDSLVSARFVKP